MDFLCEINLDDDDGDDDDYHDDDEVRFCIEG